MYMRNQILTGINTCLGGPFYKATLPERGCIKYEMNQYIVQSIINKLVDWHYKTAGDCTDPSIDKATRPFANVCMRSNGWCITYSDLVNKSKSKRFKIDGIGSNANIETVAHIHDLVLLRICQGLKLGYDVADSKLHFDRAGYFTDSGQLIALSDIEVTLAQKILAWRGRLSNVKKLRTKVKNVKGASRTNDLVWVMKIRHSEHKSRVKEFPMNLPNDASKQLVGKVRDYILLQYMEETGQSQKIYPGQLNYPKSCYFDGEYIKFIPQHSDLLARVLRWHRQQGGHIRRMVEACRRALETNAHEIRISHPFFPDNCQYPTKCKKTLCLKVSVDSLQDAELAYNAMVPKLNEIINDDVFEVIKIEGDPPELVYNPHSSCINFDAMITDVVTWHYNVQAELADARENLGMPSNSGGNEPNDTECDPDDTDDSEIDEPNSFKLNVTVQKAEQMFREAVTPGLTHVCMCCSQNWFRHSVVHYNEMKLGQLPQSLRDLLHENIDPLGKKWMCHTCNQHLQKGKIPDCASCNLYFPQLPPELDGLNDMEERLIGLRIPFMKWKTLRHGQKSLHGGVVNIPSDLSKIQLALPRYMSEASIVSVFLKRRLRDKGEYKKGQIRPEKVRLALQYLVTHETIWKNLGVSVRDFDIQADLESWLEQKSSEAEELAAEALRKRKAQAENATDSVTVEAENDAEEGLDEETQDCVDDDQSPPAQTAENAESSDDSDSETELQVDDARENATMLSTLDTDDAVIVGGAPIEVAPGEGGQPLGLFEPDAEALMFPGIYCGCSVPDYRAAGSYKCISQAVVMKWMLRNFDNRASRRLDFLFYGLQKLQIGRITSQAYVKLRKGNFHRKSYTAKQVKDPNFQNEVADTDVAFRDLKDLRGSPGYWEAAQKDIFAMLRQLGRPTFFLSLSMADTKWKHLLESLSVLDGSVPGETFETMSKNWQRITQLIADHPVECARIFRHKAQCLMKYVLRGCSDVLGKVSDFFWRDEAQQRGSMHMHSILYTLNAIRWVPHMNDKEFCDHTDKYVTCSRHNIDPDLLQFQIHHHTRTCKKKKTPRKSADSIFLCHQWIAQKFCIHLMKMPIDQC